MDEDGRPRRVHGCFQVLVRQSWEWTAAPGFFLFSWRCTQQKAKLTSEGRGRVPYICHWMAAFSSGGHLCFLGLSFLVWKERVFTFWFLSLLQILIFYYPEFHSIMVNLILSESWPHCQMRLMFQLPTILIPNANTALIRSSHVNSFYTKISVLLWIRLSFLKNL